MSGLSLILMIHGVGDGESAPPEETLPQQGNLIGEWYMDTYSTAGGRAVVPNQKASQPVSANLFSAPRRLFNNTICFSKASVTVTDNAALDPGGVKTEASTVVGTGNWALNSTGTSFATPLPPGTYTFCISHKRNTGSDQQFALSYSGSSNKSSTITSTSSWQRFAYTFTTGSNVTSLRMVSFDGATAANVQICDWEIYAGSSDLGPQVLDGHLYLGYLATPSTVTYSSGLLDMTNAGAFGMAQLSSSHTLSSGFTSICVSKQTTAGTGTTHAWLAKLQNYLHFSMLFSSIGRPYIYYANSSVNRFNQQDDGLWERLNKGLHAWALRYDGTTLSLWMDDVLFLQATVTMTAQDIQDLMFSGFNGVANATGEQFNSVMLWNTALTDAEMRTAYSVLKTRAAVTGNTITEYPRILTILGDSISASILYGDIYPYLYGPLASPAVLGANEAVVGRQLLDIEAQLAVTLARIPPNKGSRKFIATIYIGANDFSAEDTGTADATYIATYLSRLYAVCDSLRAAGYDKIAIGTQLPRNGQPKHNSRRAIFNPSLLANAVSLGKADAIFDFAGDAVMGPDTSQTDSPTYWGDATHPSGLGHTDKMLPLYRTVVDAL